MQKYTLFLACVTINLFSADDTRLKLLAREHSSFIVSMVGALNNSSASTYTPKSLIIMGSAHNGKKSLAREIAIVSQRTHDEHRLKTVAGFQEFMVQQTNISEPHVTIVNNVHLVQEKTLIEDGIEDLNENRQTFFIAIGDQKRMGTELLPLFDYEIVLNDPAIAMRRQILEHYLAQEKVTIAMLDYFADYTERMGSGKLYALVHQLIQRAQGNITHELFDDINSHIARVPIEPKCGAWEFGRYYGSGMAEIMFKSIFALMRYNRTRGFIVNGSQRELDIEFLRLVGEVIIAGLNTITR